METLCPPFLLPRLRLFLSADIVGSTSLKQTRMQGTSTVSSDSVRGPAWFSAIQGFYFEAAQAFFQAWADRSQASDASATLYGEAPVFWKSIGDEVLFTKVLSDYRQLATTLQCWFTAVERMRKFLKNENGSLDVKCTAWLAGFPFRNREVVIGQQDLFSGKQIENYYRESGNLLNNHYNNPSKSNISIDYIGPSIDTGFRLTGFSSGRKMVVSVDAAYLLSMTNSDGEIKRLDSYYDGFVPLRGVLGGAAYPIFWINMSAGNSLAVKEDKLKAQTACNREDIKDFCDSFYQEHEQYTFHPFIKAEKGQPLSNAPSWYDEYHAGLVKNFQVPDSDYNGDDSKTSSEITAEHDPHEFEKFVQNIPKKN